MSDFDLLRTPDHPAGESTPRNWTGRTFLPVRSSLVDDTDPRPLRPARTSTGWRTSTME
ncbi:hypothetical protein HBB16_08970 [Pseudonocardia sp. MCCB 268]|nr:hypothetical protein [Pseudonocardia cytotoxica]